MEQLRRMSDSCNSRAWVCTRILMCVPVSERLSATGSLLLGIRYPRVNFGPPRRHEPLLTTQTTRSTLRQGRAWHLLLLHPGLPALRKLPPHCGAQSTSCSVQGHSHASLPQAHLCSMEKPHVSLEREGRGERRSEGSLQNTEQTGTKDAFKEECQPAT